MARTFGMNARQASTRWADVMRGPSRAEVSAHVARLAYYSRNPK